MIAAKLLPGKTHNPRQLQATMHNATGQAEAGRQPELEERATQRTGNMPPKSQSL